MDATVDDFLNEINEIAPLKENTGAWQECFDEQSGFHYYWNTKTDEVTWSKPDEYIPMNKSLKTNFLPTRPQVPFDKANKIYKVGETNQPVNDLRNKGKKGTKTQITNTKSQFKRPSSDSEDEKIVLISSYGGDTDSENDEEPEPKPKPPIKFTPQPSFSKEIIKKQETSKPSHSKKPPIGGFSLVAGYSDSEEEDNEEVKSLFPIPQPQPIIENKISHSTLFPITKPIDVKDFLNAPPAEEKPKKDVKTESELVDTKAFQRKKRIAISLVNSVKKPKEETEEIEEEHKGFGSGSSEPEKKESLYAGFQKGGVMFVKSDVLPGSSTETTTTTTVVEKSKDSNSKTDVKQAESLYNILKGKLTFLSEGRPEVSPVQIMLIQAETLFLAMTDGSLLASYFNKWLSDTCADLVKLETEAAPDGWTLKWDRSHMRYFYENRSTGEGQWEYPQPDVVRCDEAMDISTTPPPEDEIVELQQQPVVVVTAPMPIEPPLPPMIRDPTPPPPPIISESCADSQELKPCDVPLPPGPSCTKLSNDSQPLPPGVDLEEPIPEKKADPADTSLNIALDSFYTDIAAIDSNSPPLTPFEETQPESNGALLDSTKKKKKTKVKLGPGLAMKKKGVSKLVEKWKNVQMGYDK